MHSTFLCVAITIVRVTGNVLVCLAVYKNSKLRSTTNLYVVALAVSDLLCATMPTPFASAVLITGRWNFGDELCQVQRFLDPFVAYSKINPTMGLLALNRYVRIIERNHYDKIFSPLKSKLWLSCVWLSFAALYMLVGRVTNWNTSEFSPGYAVCNVAFTTSEKRIIHYFVVFGLFLLLPFSIGVFSYYKIFLKIRQHKLEVAPSLQNSSP